MPTTVSSFAFAAMTQSMLRQWIVLAAIFVAVLITTYLAQKAWAFIQGESEMAAPEERNVLNDVCFMAVCAIVVVTLLILLIKAII